MSKLIENSTYMVNNCNSMKYIALTHSYADQIFRDDNDIIKTIVTITLPGVEKSDIGIVYDSELREINIMFKVTFNLPRDSNNDLNMSEQTIGVTMPEGYDPETIIAIIKNGMLYLHISPVIEKLNNIKINF